MPTIEEQKACEAIAEHWVKYIGGVTEWNARYPEMLNLFDCEIDYRTGRIDLCGIVDTWDESCGLDLEDFKRLSGGIIGWIVSYMSAYGRL